MPLSGVKPRIYFQGNFNRDRKHNNTLPSQLVGGGVENTDCTSGKTTPKIECPVYDTKQSDGEAPVLEL